MDAAHAGLVFITHKLGSWADTGDCRALSHEMRKLLDRVAINGHRGFYTLRHVFRTVADAARDPVAIDAIMGHADPSMGAVYRERIDDDRLRAVVEVVRKWLWPGA